MMSVMVYVLGGRAAPAAIRTASARVRPARGRPRPCDQRAAHRCACGTARAGDLTDPAPSSAPSDPLPGRLRSTELASTGRCAISRLITPMAGLRMPSTSTGSERSATRRRTSKSMPAGPCRRRSLRPGSGPSHPPGAKPMSPRRRRTCSTPSTSGSWSQRGRRVDQVDAVGVCARTGGRAAGQGCFGAPDRIQARGCHTCSHPDRGSRIPSRGRRCLIYRRTMPPWARSSS